MAERPDYVNKHIDDQVDAYALGILEDEEVARVEAHLANCQECQRLLRQSRAVVEGLALTPRQVAPPAGLKQRILTRIAQEERAGGQVGIRERDLPGAPPARLTPERQGFLDALRQFLPGHKASQTPGAARTGAATPAEQQQLQEIMRLLRSASPSVWELAGTSAAPQARARLLGSPEEQMAVLIVSGLEPLSPERDYQLWFLRDGKPVGGGVFDVQQSGEGQMLVRAPRRLGYYELAAITPEPAGGSPGPTGPLLIAGEIKAA